MTKAMTKGVTKPMTKPAPVKQLARRRLRFGFELCPPVANRLDATPHGAPAKRSRRSAREAILRPPSVPPHFAKRPVRTDRVRQAQNKRANNGRLLSGLQIRCSSKNFP